jgi:hypothetical protein
MRLATLLAALALLGGCSFSASVGVRPWSLGVNHSCPSWDACVTGVEAGGWQVGVMVAPDLGPVEDDPCVP